MAKRFKYDFLTGQMIMVDVEQGGGTEESPYIPSLHRTQAFWPLFEDAQDVVGEYHGTADENITFDGDGIISTAEGDDRAFIHLPLDFYAGDRNKFTFNFWIRMSEDKKCDEVYGCNGSDGNGNKFQLTYFGGGLWQTWGYGYGYDVNLPAETFTPDTWTMITLAKRDDTLRLYQNGVFKSSGGAGYNRNVEITQHRIGVAPGAKIALFSILRFDDMTEAEIQAMYTQQAPLLGVTP